MFGIIPNWHPIFVHFTIALYSIATLFFIFAWLLSRSKISTDFLTVAHWNLWVGAGFAIITVIAGFIAFNTVKYDAPAHEVLLDHRNLALVTLVGILLMALWSWLDYRKAKKPNILFLFALIIVFGFLTATGLHGGELVYGHGLGVVSLPKS